MAIISKTFKIEMAHMVKNATTKRCQTIHGHSAKIVIYLEDNINPETGMVMDFSEVKEKIGKYIDNFDHSVVLFKDEPKEIIDFFLEKFNRVIILSHNPTAECLASYFYKIAYDECKLPIKRVDYWETETGCAICEKYSPSVKIISQKYETN